MATSLLFRINNYVLLEYIYNSTTYSTSTTGFRKIKNAYTQNTNTIVNKNNVSYITGNSIDDTIVDLDNGRYALLDNDSAYFYPNYDSNIVVADIAIAPSLTVTYDKVRLHIMSGYNFEGLEGFAVSIYAQMANNLSVRLCNLSNIKSNTKRLYFNPKPLKLAEFVFDKYFEFLVPSQDYMLTQQESNPGSTTILSYYITDGAYLANQRTLYCEYENISRTIYENGLIYFELGDAVRFAFNSIDKFDLLVARIQQSSEGDFFEYYAEWDGQMIEDFIYKLNGIAGNHFYIIHELRVIEQFGDSFLETDNVTSIQTDKYDTIKRFRPILQYGSTATSFSLEYTVRLYNSSDGRSIFKTSSLTSTDVNKYGKITTKLNVGDATQPIKVYNKVSGTPVFNIADNLLKLTKTKILATFINSNDVTVASESDVDNSVNLVVRITPFDNLYKFSLNKKDPADPESAVALNLDTVSAYYMVFLKNDGSKIYVDEFISDNFKKNEGEIAFKINKKISEDILSNVSSSVFYVISRNPDGLETTLFQALHQK